MNRAGVTTAPISNTGCVYRFAHPRRPRASYNLPPKQGSTLCIWHDPAPRQQDTNVGTQLQNVVHEPDHWLEGAIFTDQQVLGALILVGANLPSADFENVDLSGTVLAEACLDDAIFLLSTVGNCTIIDGQTGTSAPALKITNPIREDAVEKLYIRL